LDEKIFINFGLGNGLQNNSKVRVDEVSERKNK